MSTRAIIRTKIGFKLICTAAILLLIFEFLDWSRISEALSSVSIFWLLLMYCMTFCRKVIDAFQMAFILRRANMSVPIYRVFLANSLSTLYGLILPGGIVSGGAKWLDLSAATGKKSAVLNAIIYNRLIPFLLLLFLGFIALLMDNPLPQSFLPESVAAFAIGGMIAFVCLYHPILGSKIEAWLRRADRYLPKSLFEKFSYTLNSKKPFREFNLHDHGIVLGIAIMGALSSLTGFTFGMEALSIEVPKISILWVFAFLAIGRLLPLTVGGFGIREGVLMLALSAFAVPLETAVAFGLVLFTNQLLAAFVGAGYQVAIVCGWTRWNAAAVSTAPAHETLVETTDEGRNESA